jgi:hypothetical protein
MTNEPSQTQGWEKEFDTAFPHLVISSQKIKAFFEKEIATAHKEGQKEMLERVIHELDGMAVASSIEFKAGYMMAIDDAKERVDTLEKELNDK